ELEEGAGSRLQAVHHRLLRPRRRRRALHRVARRGGPQARAPALGYSRARMRSFALAAVAAATAAGCQGQPELLCDRARVVWPYLEIDPSIDTSPEDGIQIDLDLRSSLLP